MTAPTTEECNAASRIAVAKRGGLLESQLTHLTLMV